MNIEEWGNKSEDECRVDSNLTSNMQQPNRLFSDGDMPASGHTPQNATTGCTTLPPQEGNMAMELPPNQQSDADWESGVVVNPQGKVVGSYTARKSKLDEIFNQPDLLGKKDPPAPSPDVYIKDFNTPSERVVPVTENNYQGPFLYIIHDQDAHYVRVEDEGENVLFADRWVKSEALPDSEIYTLEVPDPRQVQPLKDQILTLTAQNQAFAAANERLQYQHSLDEQTIRELRGANTSLLRKITELQDTNRQLAKERHALVAALQVANETMRTSIERIMSLIRVIK